MLELVEWIVFLPVLAGILLLVLPKSLSRYAWSMGIVISLVHLALVASAWFQFDDTQKGLQFLVNKSWWPELGSRYVLGLDGISLVLSLLVSVVGVMVLLGARSFTWFEPSKEKIFLSLLFLIQGGALGTFASGDTVLFYLFWEVALLPAVLLIGLFGGKDRIKAAIRFFVYTVVGSLFMLLAFAWLMAEHARQFGSPSGVFSDLIRLNLSFNSHAFWGGIGSVEGAVFFALLLAFLVKSPMFLLHGWMPKTYREAPTAATALIAAVMSKMGTYGVIRFMDWFPEALQSFSLPLMWMSALGILYGAFQAISSKNHKDLIAWSSLSHVSYILLGLFSGSVEARSGAVLQMFNHGVIIAGLFLVSGYLESRRGSLNLSDFGGYVKKTPVLAVFFMILVLASVALPGTNGFVGEFLILAGAFKGYWLIGALAATGMVLGAMYMLTLYQKMMFGKPSSHFVGKDLGLGDLLALALASCFVFSIGIYPGSFMAKIQSSMTMQSDEKVVQHIRNEPSQTFGQNSAKLASEFELSQQDHKVQKMMVLNRSPWTLPSDMYVSNQQRSHGEGFSARLGSSALRSNYESY